MNLLPPEPFWVVCGARLTLITPQDIASVGISIDGSFLFVDLRDKDGKKFNVSVGELKEEINNAFSVIKVDSFNPRKDWKALLLRNNEDSYMRKKFVNIMFTDKHSEHLYEYLVDSIEKNGFEFKSVLYVPHAHI